MKGKNKQVSRAKLKFGGFLGSFFYPDVYLNLKNRTSNLHYLSKGQIIKFFFLFNK